MSTENNPLLVQEGLPRYDEITPEHVEPAIDSLLEAAEARIADLRRHGIEINAQGKIRRPAASLPNLGERHAVESPERRPARAEAVVRPSARPNPHARRRVVPRPHTGCS